MSVYTSVIPSELKAFLQNYKVGELVSYQGITAGIENTNFYVDTTSGQFVLTLFEILKTEELPFYLELMAFLNERGVPSAHPIADRSGNYVHELKGKPATLMQRLQGRSVLHPDTHHCESIGLALANLHVAGQSFYLKQDNVRGAKWRQKTGEQLLSGLNPEDADILQRELADQAESDFQTLPHGVIHADLFRDNALFVENELSGILDFYYACNDSLLYDVAITLNDWCVEPDGALNFKRAHSLCNAYQSIRPVTTEEQKAWPLVLRQAALRFWLSRLWDSKFPKAGEMTFQKDPDEFKHILRARIAESAQLGFLWQS
ncbi:MAG: homoserine kinase [Gammaproteobacteria bacterium]|nr:homoserine kinase [Gammaproteobacteria bacterium]